MEKSVWSSLFEVILDPCRIASFEFAMRNLQRIIRSENQRTEADYGRARSEQTLKAGKGFNIMEQYSIKTEREGLYDITASVYEAIVKSDIVNGACVVYCPHTTAGITINENADPDVVHDLLFGLNKAFPDRTEFRHMEGNSAAHLKASCIGASETILIANGAPVLGTWQGIYFCEFDGPRTRNYYISITADR